MSAQGEIIPSWIKNISKLWVEGMISDEEYLQALQWLIDNGILNVQKSVESDSNASVSKEANPVTPKVSVASDKLFSLLPQKEDLSSEWKITKMTDFNKATKSFYYENAGQVNYDKNVNTIKEYRMNIFKFPSSESAQEAYDEKYMVVKGKVGYWTPWSENGDKLDKPEFKILFPEVQSILMDSQNCIAVKKAADYGDYDWLLGYCLVNNYIIYQDVTGYYPDMKDDFIKMMDIAKGKVP